MSIVYWYTSIAICFCSTIQIIILCNNNNNNFDFIFRSQLVGCVSKLLYNLVFRVIFRDFVVVVVSNSEFFIFKMILCINLFINHKLFMCTQNDFTRIIHRNIVRIYDIIDMFAEIKGIHFRKKASVLTYWSNAILIRNYWNRKRKENSKCHIKWYHLKNTITASKPQQNYK